MICNKKKLVVCLFVSVVDMNVSNDGLEVFECNPKFSNEIKVK